MTDAQTIAELRSEAWKMRQKAHKYKETIKELKAEIDEFNYVGLEVLDDIDDEVINKLLAS